MQSLQLLTPSHHRRVPWKNGLGSTLEIATDAAEPGGPWTWRLSFADVPSRAPFSAFPGVDRHLAVLDGAGLTLERGDARIAVPREGLAFTFAGEDEIIGVPTGSGVRDANLMLDRTRWRGTLELMRLAAIRELDIDAGLSLIHLASGGESAECSFEDESLRLDADSTLLCPGRVRIRAARGTLVIARIHARPNSPIEGRP
jgi:environmental stress-induced protein Ves